MDAEDCAPNGDFTVIPVARRLVVPVANESLLWIDPLGDLLGSQNPFPFFLSGSGGWQPWIDTISSLRRPAAMPITNVTLHRGDKEIVCQPDQLGAGGKLIQVARGPEAGDRSHRFEFFSSKGSLQAVGDRFFVVPLKNGPMDCAANLNDFRLAIANLNGFSPTLHVVPATLKPVLVLVRWIDLLHEYIFHVSQAGCGRPGQIVVVPN